ncbi:zonadhesin-like [Lithobates pipiens]
MTISKSKKVWVNGRSDVFPITFGRLSASAKANSILVQIDVDVKIELSDAGNLSLHVFAGLSESVCGACGNFNDDASDDLSSPAGKPVANIEQLIEAWKAQDLSCNAENDKTMPEFAFPGHTVISFDY